MGGAGVATDVGACREMIEGRSEEDRAHRAERVRHARRGAQGDRRRPRRLARDVALRWRMGAAGHQRVTAYYQRGDMLARYRALYTSLIETPAARGRREALMAGIGWKLQRMIDHGSLAGTIAAYLTGVAVTSAPWLLTTAVLTSLRLVSRHATGDFVDRRALPDRRLRGDGRAVGADPRRGLPLHGGSAL